MSRYEDASISRTFCTLCGGQCGIEVQVVDGNPVKVSGDRSSPTAGRLCVKASALLDFHTHPDRLNYPLKRVGARGENKWERIPWDQAMDEIAGKLTRIRAANGPEAVAYVGGTMHSHDWTAWRWCNLFGTPNIFAQGKNCGEAEILAECAVYGQDTVTSPAVPGVTKCAILWGWNPAESRRPQLQPVTAAKKAGAKTIVVDPRFTETAAGADIWLQLRPGTDGALALGMLNVIISEGLYDKAFVRDWCLGFDQVQDYAREFPPERAAQITTVPAEKIEEVARLYATSRPSVLSFGVAGCHLGDAAAKCAAQVKSILRAITGNLDIEGGQLMREGFEGLAWPETLRWDDQIGHPLRKHDNVSVDKFPIASIKSYALYREAQRKRFPKGYSASQYIVWVSPTCLWPAITSGNPYPVKAMITQGGNLLTSLAGAKKIHQALKSENLELHVGMDHFMTPMMQLADYVLPATDNLEMPSLSLRWGLSDAYNIGAQSVDPLFERRPDYQLWRDLASRLGQGEHWPDSLEGMFDEILEPTGRTYGQMVEAGDYYHPSTRRYEKYKEKGFGTFSGKVELIPTLFARLGYDPLPVYGEPPQSPVRTADLAKEYPLILISGSRDRYYTHSNLRQIERLRRKRPYPVLQIHPATAAGLGIAHGDWVCIETTEGMIKQVAHLTEGIAKEVVHADGYWWFPELPPQEPYLSGIWECNINAILPDDLQVCDYAGDHFFRGPLCRVYKADSRPSIFDEDRSIEMKGG